MLWKSATNFNLTVKTLRVMTEFKLLLRHQTITLHDSLT